MNSKNDSKYYKKYLKYKSRYLNLKQSAGGFDWQDILLNTFENKGHQLKLETGENKTYIYKLKDEQLFNIEITENTIIVNFNKVEGLASETLIDILLSAFNDKSFTSNGKKLTKLVIKTKDKLDNFFRRNGFKNSEEYVWTLDNNKVRVL